MFVLFPERFDEVSRGWLDWNRMGLEACIDKPVSPSSLPVAKGLLLYNFFRYGGWVGVLGVCLSWFRVTVGDWCFEKEERYA